MLPLSLAAELGDFVWADKNRDGIQDSGELGVPEIGLKLYWDRNGDGFPERLIERTVSDKSGKYLFKGIKPGTYSVGIDVDTLPEKLYLGSMRGAGEDRERDNDLNRNLWRTDPIEITEEGQKLSGTADLGLHFDNVGLEDKGIGKFVEGQYVHDTEFRIWHYQDLAIFVEAKYEVKREDMLRWARWYKKLNEFQVQLQLASNSKEFLFHWPSDTYPEEGPEIGKRNLILAWSTNGSGAIAIGGNDLMKHTLNDPESINAHWSIFYEMGRCSAGLWHSRAMWEPYDFIIAHLQTQLFMYELGGLQTIKSVNPYNGLNYGDGREAAELWKKSDYRYVDYFHSRERLGWHVDVDFGNETIKRMYATGPPLGFLYDLYAQEGIEPIVEILHLMSLRNKYAANASNGMLGFSECVNEATDNKYARVLVDVWGLPDPADHPHPEKGVSTGEFVDKSEYRWDFLAFNNYELREGCEPFTERNREGYFRWSDDTNTLWSYGYRAEGDANDPKAMINSEKHHQTTIGSFIKDHDYGLGVTRHLPHHKSRQKLSLVHELAPARWEVKVAYNSRNAFDGLQFEIEGETFSVFEKVEANKHYERVFEVDVTDGALNLALVTPCYPAKLSSGHDGIGISTLILKKLGSAKKAASSPVKERVGVNFVADRQQQDAAFDGVEVWTEAMGSAMSEVPLVGTKGKVKVSYFANAVFTANHGESSGDRLFTFYLEDAPLEYDEEDPEPRIRFEGIHAWLEEVGAEEYSIRVYGNSDNATLQTADIYVGGDRKGKVDFGRDPSQKIIGTFKGLKEDSFTIRRGRDDRARFTIAGVQLIAKVP
ncbi:MAG: SdrD B-like domain-containing protein [Verrucomicrobiota bacterium]